MTITSKLFPVPRQLAYLGGDTKIPETPDYSVGDSQFDAVASLLAEELSLAQGSGKPGFLRFEEGYQSANNKEAYKIVVDKSGILIQASTPSGAFRATRTVKQLLSSGVTRLPRIEIHDHPAFPNRGFMLDVSRCKVPTMETILNLVDLLADLKYNEFQLYIEHTFAFAKHEPVWKDASPLTADQIRLIDAHCLERFIELVPNLNSFGHFERWLCHEHYKHLAECPEGFRREHPYIIRNHGTTLKPNAESLAFIDSLYAEYLPNFTSPRFNVGMDEPWELGQGWSRPQVKERGRHAVYLDHLEGIRKLVEKHERKMLFWADILLEKPEKAIHVPKSASPVVWGYESEHPFEEQAEVLSACNLSFYLAPGTSSWRSFTGRMTNSLANLRNAIDAGLVHGASGILLTNWGDCGNHQSWSTLYPALLHGGGLAWNETSNPESDLPALLDQFIFPNESETPSEDLIALGKLDLTLGRKISNTSLPWLLLFSSQPEKLPEQLNRDHPAKNLNSAQEILKGIRPRLATLAEGSNTTASLAARELLLGLDLSTHGLSRGQKIIGEAPPAFLPSPKEITSRYEAVWLERARAGGLAESLELLEEGLTRQD